MFISTDIYVLLSYKGRSSPTFISHSMVSNMAAGSVIVDMAASPDGGNCEITEVTHTINHINVIFSLSYNNCFILRRMCWYYVGGSSGGV